MCTGRLDLSFVLRAFARGADGVFVGGCWPGECHYVTEGNYDALGVIQLGRKLLGRLGLSPERLRLEWVAASEGSRFAEVMNDFVARLKALGRLGQAEGVDPEALATGLEAAQRLVPYLKLVERERLRPPVRTEEAVAAFYADEQTERLFGELIGDRLAASRILLLLDRGPASTREIAESLGLKPSEVSRHMASSVRQGLVHYDLELGRYALPRVG